VSRTGKCFGEVKRAGLNSSEWKSPEHKDPAGKGAAAKKLSPRKKPLRIRDESGAAT
jgi:hypothetical protein